MHLTKHTPDYRAVKGHLMPERIQQNKKTIFGHPITKAIQKESRPKKN